MINEYDNSKRTSSREVYIDGIKGLACLMIMITHYFGIVRRAEVLPADSFNILLFISNKFIKTVIDDSVWLQVFFVISGYLLSKTSVQSIKELLIRSFLRFIRLYIPMMGACILIFLIEYVIGFHNNIMLVDYTNTWFSSYYKSKFIVMDIMIDPLKALIVGGSKMNSPYWVIHGMFLSSLIIYLCNYTKRFNKYIHYVICLLSSVISLLFLGTVCFACCAGMFISILDELPISIKKNSHGISQ